MKQTLRKLSAATLTAVFLLTASACGSSDDDKSTTTRNTATTLALKTKGPGSCNVKMTGSVTHTINGKGGVSAISSDYWFSTPQLQKALDKSQESPTPEDDSNAEQKVANGDFVINGLLLHCFEQLGDHYSVDFTTTASATRSNFPFSAKSYVLTGDPASSILNVLVSAGSRRIWKISSGTLNIETFDQYGIAGNFNFDATDDNYGQGTPKNMHAEGTFDLPCASGDLCEKRPKATTTTSGGTTGSTQLTPTTAH